MTRLSLSQRLGLSAPNVNVIRGATVATSKDSGTGRKTTVVVICFLVLLTVADTLRNACDAGSHGVVVVR